MTGRKSFSCNFLFFRSHKLQNLIPTSDGLILWFLWRRLIDYSKIKEQKQADAIEIDGINSIKKRWAIEKALSHIQLFTYWWTCIHHSSSKFAQSIKFVIASTPYHHWMIFTQITNLNTKLLKPKPNPR